MRNHHRVQPHWARGLLACFPDILLFVTDCYCDSRQISSADHRRCVSHSIYPVRASSGCPCTGMELVLELLATNTEYQRVLGGLSCNDLVRVLGLMLGVASKAVRAHGHAVCHWHAEVLARALFECTSAPTPLLRSVLHGVALRPGRVPLEVLASMADYETRGHESCVRRFLQRHGRAGVGVSADEAHARACLCASTAMPLPGDPYLAHCRCVQSIVVTGCRQPPQELCWHVHHALAARAQAPDADVVPNTVLDTVRGMAVVAWDELRAVGVWCQLLTFVRVHMRVLPLHSVQARVFLRDAVRAWRAQEHSGWVRGCERRQYADMLLGVLECMAAEGRAPPDVCSAGVDALAAVVGACRERQAASYWQRAWGVLRRLYAACDGDSAPMAPGTHALIDAHLQAVRVQPGAEGVLLLECIHVAVLPRAACAHLLRALWQLHATGGFMRGRLAALCDVAARAVRALGPGTGAEGVRELADCACSLLVGELYMPSTQSPPPDAGGFAALRFITAVGAQHTARDAPALPLSSATILRDAALTLDHLLTEHPQCLQDPAVQATVLDAVCTLSTLVLRRRLARLNLSHGAVERLLQFARTSPKSAGLAAAYALHAAVYYAPQSYSVDLVVRHCEGVCIDTCPRDSLHFLVQVLARVVAHSPAHGKDFLRAVARFAPVLCQRTETVVAVARGASAAARGGHAALNVSNTAYATVLRYVCPLDLTRPTSTRECRARLQFALVTLRGSTCDALRRLAQPHLAVLLAVSRAAASGHALSLWLLLRCLVDRHQHLHRAPRSTLIAGAATSVHGGSGHSPHA